jgi:anaerobic selenocysteine-containing dehydrogenase
LEHDHYDMSFHTLAVRNTARYNPAIFDKPEGTLHDWEIFVGLGEVLAHKLDVETRPARPPHELIDYAIQAGPYGGEEGLSLQTLREQPSGVDLGALKPSCPQRIQTVDKKIQSAPQQLLQDVQRLQQWRLEQSDGLRLIGRRHVRSNNSWMHNSHRLVKGKPRCQLWVNPRDLNGLALKDGDSARLSSRVGAVEVDILVTEDIMPGTVSLPHGWGHGRKGVELKVARQHAGVSANDVTDELLLDQLSGNTALNGVPVRLEALT